MCHFLERKSFLEGMKIEFDEAPVMGRNKIFQKAGDL